MSKENREFGRHGAEVINDDVAHNDLNAFVVSFYAFSEIAAITITDANDEAFDGNTLVGEVFPPGYELYGKITSIELVNGACIAYKDEETA